MNLNLQNLALGSIIAAIALAFLVVVVADVVGHPASEATRLYVFGLFTGIAGSAATWLAASKATDARNAEMFARLRAENMTLKAGQFK